jgi:2-hydroxychromene-2-carboxylate isomerase
MNGQVEFFFDFMSPYSYLAATRIEAVVGAAGGAVVYRPCFLPGLLKATGNRGPAEIPAKLAYTFKDLSDWARALNLPPIRVPETFPFLTTQASRAALVAIDEGQGPAFVRAMFDAIWRDGKNGADEAVIGEVLSACGLEGPRVLALASSQGLKDRLKAATDEAMQRGAFGVPTFFAKGEMFVGNDRLDFVAKRLQRQE